MSGGLRLDFVFPRFKVLSGAERLVLELTAALSRAGHRPRIICHQFDTSCADLLVDDVELVKTGIRLDWFGNRYLNAGFDYLRAPALARSLDPGADAVIVYGPALRLAPRLRRRGIPVVYHCFEPPRALYQDRGDVLRRAGAARWLLLPLLAAYRRYDRRLVRYPGAVLASGPYAAGRFEETYDRPAIPVTHGLDRARLRQGDAEPTSSLVTVNYLHPRKRVDLAIRAVARIDEPLAGDEELPTLLIVGAGPEREALERLSRELAVSERVRFAGFVAEDRLGATLRSARCYLHTAREESFGLSVIEAAYCGLPVVAVAEGGVVDNVIDGETGRLVKADAGALALAVREVFAVPDGPEALGQRGHEHVDSLYTWEQGAEDLLRAVAEAQYTRRDVTPD